MYNASLENRSHLTFDPESGIDGLSKHDADQVLSLVRAAFKRVEEHLCDRCDAEALKVIHRTLDVVNDALSIVRDVNEHTPRKWPDLGPAK